MRTSDDHLRPSQVKRLAIDWNGLEDAQLMLSAMHGEMGPSLQFFLDRETGKVVSLTESAFAAAAGEEPEPDRFTGELPDEEQVELTAAASRLAGSGRHRAGEPTRRG